MTGGGEATVGDIVECAKCERSVRVEDAVMLTHKTSKGLWKYLCPSCLKEIGVPQGYDLDRDVTHLNPQADSLDEVDDEDQSTDDNRSVIADFQCQVVTSNMSSDEMQQGRVVMNESQLVLVSGEQRAPIELKTISDINIEQASASTREYFDDVVKIAYESSSVNHSAFIGASAEIIDTFTTVLFKGLLNGTSVRVKYPAKVNGRPRAPDLRQGVLRLADGTLTVEGISMPPEIDPSSVVNIANRRRDWPTTQPYAFEVTQREFEGITTAAFEFPSTRLLNIAGRFIQGAYGDRVARLHEANLDRSSRQILAALWTLATIESVPAIVGEDEETVAETVETLTEEGFLREEQSNELTTLGVVAVLDYFETEDQ